MNKAFQLFCCCAGGVLLALWLYSLFWYVGYQSTRYDVALLPHCLRLSFHRDLRMEVSSPGPDFVVCKVNAFIKDRTKYLPAISYPYGIVDSSFVEVYVPLWLLFAACVGFVFILRCRARKKECGLCRECEYNLRGNISGICPECGQPVNNNN